MNRQVEVRLFGALRSARGDCLRLSVDAGANVAALRAALAHALPDDGARALLEVSAFGTDDALLDDGDALPADGRVCILPPVCGG